MSGIIKAAASALQAQQYNLDIIANNIANIGTTGYKKARATFVDAVRTADSSPARGSTAGVVVAATQRIFSAGAITETGNLSDLAIMGDGFFQVRLPNGITAYTRDGSFSLDAEGYMVTAQGASIDPLLTIPANAKDVWIDEMGVVRGTVDGEETQLGEISLATFSNPEGLLSVGHSLFLATDASGQAQLGSAGTGVRGLISSGVLESSNVDLTEEMTRAIEAQRAYQLSIKMLQTADQMLGLANDLRR